MEGLTVLLLVLVFASLSLEAGASSVTFSLRNAKGEAIELSKHAPRATTLAPGKGKLLFASTVEETAVEAALSNSFIGSIYNAYSRHFVLRLRADDVLLTVVVALAGYIDAHAEEMRSLFVTHQGKKTLTIETAQMGEHIIELLSDAVNAEISAEARGFVEPHFSTTTPKDRLVARAALLGAMQKYFGYRVMLMCGIPQVVMMGTPADWHALKAKIADMGVRWPALKGWVSILLPIADEFIASAEGRPNEEFWQSCVHSESFGSGSWVLSGWVLAFAPWTQDGEWRLNEPSAIVSGVAKSYGSIDSDDFSSSASVSMPIEVNDNGREYKARLYVGGFVNTYEEATKTIAPSFDYAMYEVPE